MITEIEALSFLRNHQPMPDDGKVKKEELEKYEEIRRFYLNYFDEKCIPLFLNSFGGKDGFGIYQMVEDVILMYSKEVVMPYILDAFNNPSENVKYWSIQISSNFPDDMLFLPLVNMLQLEDEDIKFATITALAQLAINDIRRDEVIIVLKDEIERDLYDDIKTFAEEILLDIQSST